MPTNEQIREWIEAQGIVFAPWETAPWEVHEGEVCPYSDLTCMGARTWPAALKLRARAIAALTA
jgi:hypothetical protein